MWISLRLSQREAIPMKQHAIPLKLVEESTDPGQIVAARRLFDGMTEEELRDSAPITEEQLESFLKSHNSQTAETCFNELLDMDGQNRVSSIDVEKELEEVPKNYDVAIALNSFEYRAKIRPLMEYLTEKGVAREPLDIEVFEEFDEIDPADVNSLRGDDEEEQDFECAHCGQVIDSPHRFSTHLQSTHPEEVNWLRGVEVHVGIFENLANFREYDGKKEVERRFARADQNSPEAWRDFVPHPRQFLAEYGLPEEKQTKRDLQGTFEFGATSLINRADIVFLNHAEERAVIVENKETITKGAFDQVQTYAGLMQDDYPFLDEPRTAVNFYGGDFVIKSGERRNSTSVDGVRDTHSIDHPVRIMDTHPDVSVFELPSELQDYLGG
jgi:hypothetical protein